MILKASEESTMTYICLVIPTAYLLVIAVLDWFQVIVRSDYKNIIYALLNTAVVVTGSMVLYRTWNGCSDISFWTREVDLAMKTITIIWMVIFSLTKKAELGDPPEEFKHDRESWEVGKQQATRIMMMIDLSASVLFSVGVLLGC